MHCIVSVCEMKSSKPWNDVSNECIQCQACKHFTECTSTMET